MEIKTTYDIGEKFTIPCYRFKGVETVTAEIKKIKISRSACGIGIKYELECVYDDERFTSGLWEEDLQYIIEKQKGDQKK